MTTTFAAEDSRTVAQIVMRDGTITELPYDEALKLLEAHRPPPETSDDVLERDVIGMLGLLFQHRRTHSVILDNTHVGVEVGYVHDRSHLHYVNGHTLVIAP